MMGPACSALLCLPPSTVAFMTPGWMELLVIATLALLVWGGDLPDVMRSLGRAYGKLRGSVSEFSRPVRDEVERVKRSARDSLTTRVNTTSGTPPTRSTNDAAVDSPTTADTPRYEDEEDALLDPDGEYTLDASHDGHPQDEELDTDSRENDFDDDPPFV